MTPDIRTPEQRAQQERRTTEREQEERNLCDAHYHTFSTEFGRIVLKDLERRGYLYTTTLTGPIAGPIDEIQSWTNEGRRQLVIYIKSMIERGLLGSHPLEVEKATTEIG